MKVSNETKVGLLAFFALAILILGYSFLKGNNLFKTDKLLYVVYDNIQGLNPSDAVVVNGFKVGRVAKLGLVKEDGKILAALKISEDIVIPKGSIAKIVSQDLLGTKAIDITMNEGAEASVNGDTLLPAIQADLAESVKMEIIPVKLKAEQLMGSFDSLLARIQVILGANTIENSLGNVESATANVNALSGRVDSIIAAETVNIKAIIDNLARFTGTLNANEENITNVITNLSALSDSLAQAQIPTLVASLEGTLREAEALLTQINSGEGTAGKLINDEELYNNLLAATASLDSLLVDVKANPSRYVHVSVFGKKDK